MYADFSHQLQSFDPTAYITDHFSFGLPSLGFIKRFRRDMTRLVGHKLNSSHAGLLLEDCVAHRERGLLAANAVLWWRRDEAKDLIRERQGIEGKASSVASTRRLDEEEDEDDEDEIGKSSYDWSEEDWEMVIQEAVDEGVTEHSYPDLKDCHNKIVQHAVTGIAWYHKLQLMSEMLRSTSGSFIVMTGVLFVGGISYMLFYPTFMKGNWGRKKEK